MNLISVGDFRNGITFELDGNVYQVVEFQHVKPGKGAAFVRTKLKDIINNLVIEKTFRPSEKVPKANVERKDMQYLYNDGELYYFMDQESYEQLPINADKIKDSLKFVKENDIVRIMIYKGNVFGIEPPNFVELEIIQTEPGVRGDTATSPSKSATLETGAIIQVPLFIEQGQRVRVNTKTGAYMERA